MTATAGLSVWTIGLAATHVGLPSMQSSLGISVTASQWILNLTLMFLAGIVTVGGAWTRLRSRMPFGREKSPKMPKNPASQVHPIRMADHPVSRKKPSSGIATTKYTPNRQGGERRLNVAIIRARIAVKLIASFEPEDIDLARTDSRGARLLRSYMKTPRDGILAVFEGEFGNPDAEFDSPFEEAVFNALTHHGIKLVKQVGVSKYKIDFGVVDPEKPSRYLLGIECDGATYHSSPTARDRDRLRQQILEEKYCWKIHRIWSRDWVNDSKGEINKVLNSIDESRRQGAKKPTLKKRDNPGNIKSTKNSQKDTNIQQEKIPSQNSFPINAQFYRPGRLRNQNVNGASEFHNIPINSITNGFIAIVDFEGPIHRNVAKKRVADAFNVRIGNKVNDRLDLAITYGVRNGNIRLDGLFPLSSKMTEIPLKLHREGEPERRIEEIHPQEIDAGVTECVKNSMSIGLEDVVVETAKLFGLRATKKVSENIERRITYLFQVKKLDVKVDNIIMSNHL